jgi:hypothetical protein
LYINKSSLKVYYRVSVAVFYSVGWPVGRGSLLPRPIARALRHKPPCRFRRYVGYKHPQLGDAGHIRLLKLLQGSQGAPLTCSFLPTSISPAPKYAAISYAWGDPLLKHKIKCEDGELSVTENVKVLLGHLRDPGEENLSGLTQSASIKMISRNGASR